MRALTFKIEDGIDHMFNDTGACDLPVFGDVTDKDHRRAGFFGKTREFLCTLTDLRDGAWRGAELIGPERLDGIDHDYIRLVGHQPVEDWAE